MKRIGISAVIGTFIVLLTIATCALAHPPKEVNLFWNGKGVLEVQIVHGVDNPKKHYINQVNLYINDKLIAKREFLEQESPEGLSLSFDLPDVKPGNRIKIEAICVIFGSKSNEITIP